MLPACNRRTIFHMTALGVTLRVIGALVVVVEKLSGLTLAVRPAEDWELSP